MSTPNYNFTVNISFTVINSVANCYRVYHLQIDANREETESFSPACGGLVII